MQHLLDKYEVESKEQYFSSMLICEDIGAIQMAKDMFAELNAEQIKDFNKFVNNRERLEFFITAIK